jgi:hypothetical protein
LIYKGAEDVAHSGINIWKGRSRGASLRILAGPMDISISNKKKRTEYKGDL